MNVLPYIQEKWSLIGTRLMVASDKLDDIYQRSKTRKLSTESMNTYCCIEMLKYWSQEAKDASIDTLINAIDAPHVGLENEMVYIKNALTTPPCLNTNETKSQCVTNPPKAHEQLYLDVKTGVCLELKKCAITINDIIEYLEFCRMDSKIIAGVKSFPSLINSLEDHDHLNKSDVDWFEKYCRTF